MPGGEAQLLGRRWRENSVSSWRRLWGVTGWLGFMACCLLGSRRRCTGCLIVWHGVLASSGGLTGLAEELGQSGRVWFMPLAFFLQPVLIIKVAGESTAFALDGLANLPERVLFRNWLKSSSLALLWMAWLHVLHLGYPVVS